MDTAAISVLFGCKLCTIYYQKVEDFISHKKELHFEEFQKTNCIVFEERNNHVNKVDDGSPAPVSNDEDEPEALDPFVNDPTAVEVEVEKDIDPLTSNITLNGNPTTALLSISNVELQTVKNHTRKVAPNFLELITDNYCNPAVSSQSSLSRSRSRVTSTLNSSLFGDANADASVALNFEDSNTFEELDIKPDLGDLLTQDSLQPTTELVTFESVLINKRKPQMVIRNSSPPHFDAYKILKSENENELDSDNGGNDTDTINHHIDPLFGIGLGIGPVPVPVPLLMSKPGPNNVKQLKELHCKICSKVFPPKAHSNLRRHRETHKKKEDRVKRYTCSICGKSYFLSHHLTVHMTSHSDEMPFHCPQPNCDKVFKIKEQVKQHLVSHFNFRPFKCTHPNCDKSYKLRASLNCHLETHAEPKRFSCPHTSCGKKFNCRKSMLKHVRRIVHVGELPPSSTQVP